jgi:drug/metabolite transporter (DMT)-like permease
MWSLSGAFTKALTTPTVFGFDQPPIERFPLGDLQVPVQIAFYRAFFAGLVLVPTLRPSHITFKPMMLVMLICFAVMNVSFIFAQSEGTSANAILLQNSAPLWMFLVSIIWLGEKATLRSTISLLVGMIGIGVIIVGEGLKGSLLIVGFGLLSGVTYAAVILCLRVLRDVAPNWLTVWNHLLGSLVLLPLVVTLPPPTWQQVIVLLFFGAIQLGFPYWLMARGLRSVSAPEAGVLTLLEPILTPVWTYFVNGEQPEVWTYVGGAVILVALAYRYFPSKPLAA